MIDGIDFTSKDMFGESDPYLIIKCGDFVIN